LSEVLTRKQKSAKVIVYGNFSYFSIMKIKPLLLLLIPIQFAYSQEKESFFVFDENWKPTDVKTAKFILRVQNLNDTSWQWDYYNMFGPLLKTEHYKSKEAKMLHGSVAYYNSDGFLDSTGTYVNGKKEGDFWRITEDSMRLSWEWRYVYHNDTLTKVINEKNESKDVYIYDSSDPENTFGKPEIESVYPGGISAWQKFLYKNFKYPDRAMNNNIEGQVWPLIFINKQGEIENSYLGKSVEYSLDEEALRIMRKSGKWVPAVQDGKNVRSFKIQPIIFKLQ
jgi:TonB family protein